MPLGAKHPRHYTHHLVGRLVALYLFLHHKYIYILHLKDMKFLKCTTDLFTTYARSTRDPNPAPRDPTRRQTNLVSDVGFDTAD